MRLATVVDNGATRAVRIDGRTAVALPYANVGELLAEGALGTVGEVDGEAWALDDLQYGELVPRPEKIICAGLNYRSHIVETGRNLDDWTDYPMLFAKFWRSLLGPTDDLVMPGNSDRVDWEAELAVIVGHELYHGDENEALAAIAGYTVLNDVSMRDWQIRTPEMLQGKTFERCTPVGPVLVTGDEIDDATHLRVTCTIDDVVMQDGNTSDMLFSSAQLVAYASQFVTLAPGDIIATGTPGGIGARQDPPVYLLPGKTMRTAVEGIGELVNHCIAAEA